MTFPIQRAFGFAAPLLLAFGMAADSSAQTTLTTELVAGGFSNPLEAIGLPGDDRIFVVEQNQADIHIIDGSGSVLPTPFLDLTGKVQTGGERGLLGLAFHPDYANNGYFYVNYTRSSPNRTVIERYQVSANPNVANAASGLQLLSYSQPFSNHNGGCLRFGPDGYLYIGTGDGGSGGDPQCYAQNPNSMLGKMLRIDVDGAAPYGIPADNPWASGGSGLPEIWAVGLRNPWRYSFDSLTGDLYIGDVGQNSIEEVDWLPTVPPPVNKPYNFGWKMMEGNNCFGTGSCVSGTFPPCNDPSLVDPVGQYAHTGPFGGPCSITGGEVSRDAKIPGTFGTYFFADYCSAQIWSFELVGGVMTNFQERTSELAPGGGLSINTITSFGADGDGSVLICDFGGGEIYRIKAASQPALNDCDSNGKEDSLEILMDPNLDLNGNGVLDSCEGCGYSAYGVGAAPANYMTLAGSGGSGVGTTAQFVTTGVVSGPVFTAISLAQDNFPLFGGTGLVNLVLTIQIGVTPAVGGQAVYSVPIPADPAMAGLSVYTQSGAPDAGQPGGWGLSNGLKLDVCP